MNRKRVIFIVWLSFFSSSLWANCYDPKRTTEENFASCKQAAEEGEAMAQYFVGQMYRKGDGVAKNPQEAVNWYLKAATQKSRPALFNLGWMYETGENIEQDLDEAISWYTKAARLGDPYAPFNIGALYFAGKELPRDPENALFWFEVAIENGNSKGMKWRHKIAEHLKPEQLDSIQKRLEDWRSKASGVEQ